MARDKAVQVLILMEPKEAHDEKCPAYFKNSGVCNCYLLRNAHARATALDEAGLLVSDQEKET